MTNNSPDIDELIRGFVEVAKIANTPLTTEEVQGEFLAAPHRRPSSLPSGKQAVYAFLLGQACLKVGKAGPKTQARFTSQHYGPNNAPSTLARSVLTNRDRLKAIASLHQYEQIERLDEQSIGTWLEQNTARLHIFLSIQRGGLVLSLLESFVQCRLAPVFEGKKSEQ